MKLTVISSMFAADDRRSTIAEALRLPPNVEMECDLITVVDPWLTLRDGGPELRQLIADADVSLMRWRHDRIAVAMYGESFRFAEMLRRQPELEGWKGRIDHVHLGDRPPRGSTIVICCGDARLHRFGFEEELRMGLDLFDAPALLAFPGGPREIDGRNSRSLLLLGQLRRLWERGGFRQIALVAHTGCGPCDPLGQPRPFASPKREREDLSPRLRKAAEFLKPIFPAVNVRTGIAHLEGDRLGKVSIVSLA